MEEEEGEKKNLKEIKRNQTVAKSNKEQSQLFTLRHFTDNFLVAIAFAFVKRFSKAASWQFLRSFPYFKSCLSFLFLVRIRYCTGLRPLFSRCPLLMCLVDWLNSLYQLAQIQMLWTKRDKLPSWSPLCRCVCLIQLITCALYPDYPHFYC